MMIRLFNLRFRLTPLKKRNKLLRKKGMKIGKRCEIYGSVTFGNEMYLIEIGDDVHITSGCRFLTHDGGVFVLHNLFEDSKHLDLFGKIIIGNNVFIGNNCIILPNVRIGNNVIIGAGSIVTRDIPDNSVAVGVPCKAIHSIEEYHQKAIQNGDNTYGQSAKHKYDYLKKKYDL